MQALMKSQPSRGTSGMDAARHDEGNDYVESRRLAQSVRAALSFVHTHSVFFPCCFGFVSWRLYLRSCARCAVPMLWFGRALSGCACSSTAGLAT